jgi:hypothetical protein
MGFSGYVARQQFWVADVRFGSKADIGAYPHHVRYSTKSAHWFSVSAVRFVPKADIRRCNKIPSYSIT